MDILKKNYFDLFGIEVEIEINISSLNKKYSYLQQQFHPDKYANSSNHEKLLALQISSYINDGYKTLGDLVKRIEYILKINNFYKDEAETLKDNDFLLEQIEYNEFFDDLKNKSDEEIDLYRKNILKKVSSTINRITQAFDNKSLEEMWNYLAKLRFYIKHVNELKTTKNKI